MQNNKTPEIDFHRKVAAMEPDFFLVPWRFLLFLL